MKKTPLTLILIIFFTIFISFHNNKGNSIKATPCKDSRSGVAIILTGAAARIPQQVALLEELDKRGLLKNVVFISGVSAGALNSVALNGILSNKVTWDEYKNILFALKDSNIFIQEGKKIPFNTSPVRALFKSLVEDKLGYHCIGDLPYTTSISITYLEGVLLKKIVYRMCSRKINEESDTTLCLIDIMRASSAIPFIFPPVKIENVKTIPDVEYIDGGVGDDRVPYHALLEFEKYRGIGVEKVYIISRKIDSTCTIGEELTGLGLNEKGRFDNLNISLDAIRQKGLIKSLESFVKDAPELAPLSYVWIPDFKPDFLLFHFDNFKEQYDVTSKWAKDNSPISLTDYLIREK
jgi:predicted acylesterase/phospholipase RssA